MDTSIPVPQAPAPAKRAASPPRNLPPAKQPVVGASMPPQQLLEMMVRSILVAVNQANFTGNYSVLHALGTRELQTKTKPEDLGASFAMLRKQGIDLTPALALPVVFTRSPSIGPDGALALVGYVPAEPRRIDFAIVYYPVAGYWRIDALQVSTAEPRTDATGVPTSPAVRVPPPSSPQAKSATSAEKKPRPTGPDTE